LIAQAGEAMSRDLNRNSDACCSRAARETPGSERLTQALQRHGEAFFGVAIAEHGVPLYTDARHYTAVGIPTEL